MENISIGMIFIVMSILINIFDLDALSLSNKKEKQKQNIKEITQLLNFLEKLLLHISFY